MAESAEAASEALQAAAPDGVVDLPLAIREVLDGEVHLSPTLRQKLDYEPDASGA